MSCILYYSNYCEKCKNILRLVGKSELKDDIHFICIDKRFRNLQDWFKSILIIACYKRCIKR